MMECSVEFRAGFDDVMAMMRKCVGSVNERSLALDGETVEAGTVICTKFSADVDAVSGGLVGKFEFKRSFGEFDVSFSADGRCCAERRPLVDFEKEFGRMIAADNGKCESW